MSVFSHATTGNVQGESTENRFRLKRKENKLEKSVNAFPCLCRLCFLLWLSPCTQVRPPRQTVLVPRPHFATVGLLVQRTNGRDCPKKRVEQSRRKGRERKVSGNPTSHLHRRRVRPSSSFRHRSFQSLPLEWNKTTAGLHKNQLLTGGNNPSRGNQSSCC